MRKPRSGNSVFDVNNVRNLMFQQEKTTMSNNDCNPFSVFDLSEWKMTMMCEQFLLDPNQQPLMPL